MSLTFLLGLISAAASLPLSTAQEPSSSRAAKVIVAGIDRRFDWNHPFRPEPWWPVGGAIFQYFDHDTIVVSGKNIPDLVERLDARLSAGGFEHIARIEFWTHGGPGYFRIQEKRWFSDLFSSDDPKIRASLEKLRARLAIGGVIHFRSCSTFQGTLGRRFAAEAARFFNATERRITIMGHTRPTGLTHPGWKTVPPGHSTDWPTREGVSEGPLEGMEIAGRDVTRILTGGVYDAVLHVREQTLPAAIAHVGTALRYNDWALSRAGP